MHGFAFFEHSIAPLEYTQCWLIYICNWVMRNPMNKYFLNCVIRLKTKALLGRCACVFFTRAGFGWVPYRKLVSLVFDHKTLKAFVTQRKLRNLIKTWVLSTNNIGFRNWTMVCKLHRKVCTNTLTYSVTHTHTHNQHIDYYQLGLSAWQWLVKSFKCDFR